MASLETASSAAGDRGVGTVPLSRRAAWANLLSVSGAHGVIHATVVLLPLIYPILRQEYHLSYVQIGLLITIPNLIGGLAQVIFGYLSRYVARKALIGVGNVLVGLSMFLMGVFPTYAGFLGFGVMRNLASAPQHPVGSALLTDTFGRARHGVALAAHVAGGNLGTLLVPFIGTALILRLGWQPTLMLFALPGLIGGTLVLAVTRDPTPLVARRRQGHHALAEAAPRVPVPRGARLAAALAPLRHRGVVLVMIASVVAAGGRGVGILTTYLPLSFTSDLHLSPGVVATLFTLLLLGSVAGPLVAGRLSDRFGRQSLLLLSYGLSAAFIVLLPLVGGAGASLAPLVVVVALIGAVAYAESPLMQAYLADQSVEAEMGIAFGWFFTLAFGVGSLWGVLIGKVIDVTSFSVAFWVMATSYLLAGAILLGMPRTPRASGATGPHGA